MLQLVHASPTGISDREVEAGFVPLKHDGDGHADKRSTAVHDLCNHNIVTFLQRLALYAQGKAQSRTPNDVSDFEQK